MSGRRGREVVRQLGKRDMPVDVAGSAAEGVSVPDRIARERIPLAGFPHPGPAGRLGYRSPRVRTLLLYAQDVRGVGHITRTVTIARHIMTDNPSTIGFIATRSPLAKGITLPDHCEYVKLPSRHTPKHIARSAEDDEMSKAQFRQLRSRVLYDVALGLAPDLVLVDHEPLGASGEFRDGLWALKAASPDTAFVFGLRDIMDDADRVRAEWRKMGVYEALEQLYDGIAVYGSQRLYDVAEAYDIPPSVRPKLHYCGYTVRDRPDALDPAAVRQEHGLPPNGPLVLAVVGGGYDGYPLLEAALTAVDRMRAAVPGLCAILVTGPFMPSEKRAALQARATSACRVVEHADNFQLMGVADAIVSMGGYNSVCEALVTGRPLVIVPRATRKIEQRIRAELLTARGLARWIHPNDLDGESLADALDWALRQDPGAHARRVREVIPSFDGAAQLSAYVSRWLGEPSGVEVPAPSESSALAERLAMPDPPVRLAEHIHAAARGDSPSAQKPLEVRLASALDAVRGWTSECVLNALSTTRATGEELEQIDKLLENLDQISELLDEKKGDGRDS